ncbi:MAG: hypothetical protein FWE22_08715 [Firmicutes bacterium]|nr:hypothetical protein [Bacillota bacterium]
MFNCYKCKKKCDRDKENEKGHPMRYCQKLNLMNEFREDDVIGWIVDLLDIDKRIISRDILREKVREVLESDELFMQFNLAVENKLFASGQMRCGVCRNGQ